MTHAHRDFRTFAPLRLCVKKLSHAKTRRRQETPIQNCSDNDAIYGSDELSNPRCPIIQAHRDSRILCAFASLREKISHAKTRRRQETPIQKCSDNDTIFGSDELSNPRCPMIQAHRDSRTLSAFASLREKCLTQKREDAKRAASAVLCGFSAGVTSSFGRSRQSESIFSP
jgi:hypothetical protein